MLGGCPENTWVSRQIALGKRRHDAAGARAGNAETNAVADRDSFADPIILDKVRFAACSLYNDVWPKSSDFKTPLWVQFAKPIQGSRR